MAGLCKTRRIGVLAASAASIGAWFLLMWVLLPDAVARVRTPELLALLGLLVLPAGAITALVAERHGRRRGREAVHAASDEPPARAGAAAPLELEVDAGEDVEEAEEDAWGPVWSAVVAGDGDRVRGGGLAAAARR